MRPALAVAVAAMLVVAGCAGSDGTTTDPTGTAPTDRTTTTTGATTVTSTAASADDTGSNLDIDVMNGPLPFDPNVTYARVQRMLGTNVSPPGAVMVIPGMDAAGSASNTGRVYLDAKDEAVLAHEFTHSILLRATPEHPVGSPDATFAQKAAVEGAAEYVQAAYTRRYLDRPPSPMSALPRHPRGAYFLGRYYYGYRYMAARVDDPSGVVAIHERPPTTSEQVLHGYARDEEPIREFVVSVSDRHLSSDAAWQYAGVDRLGEITLRLTLRTRLPTERAAAGADGWGNDRLVTFQSGGDRGFAWLVRWDDAANATEFAAAFRAYRNESTKPFGAPPRYGKTPNAAFTRLVWQPSDASMALRRVSPEVTVVAVGSSSFVAAVEASGGNSSVTVSVG